MSRSQWKLFWQVNFPHGVRNCWWRLLIRKLSTRKVLNHCDGGSPLCKFCTNHVEDDYHMIFDCPKKRSFWLVARKIFHIELPMDDIWPALVFTKKVDTKTMTRLGEILLVIWQVHWSCTLDEIPWNTTHAIRRLRRIYWREGISLE
ncbi:hypothetical protein BC941DRAFT_364469 [Chlamydoabsidia padenii]|nr:hypothetical protein BC941DRAFT_364469 [Chlamydoabsidia padenii]